MAHFFCSYMVDVNDQLESVRAKRKTYESELSSASGLDIVDGGSSGKRSGSSGVGSEKVLDGESLGSRYL